MKGLERRLHPITAKRLRRFRGLRRAYVAFWLLLVLYGVSLFSEFIANGRPLVVRAGGHWLFPAARDWIAPVLRLIRRPAEYSEHEILGNGEHAPARYRELAATEAFRGKAGNWMLFPPVPYGPDETLRPDDIPRSGAVSVSVIYEQRVGSVDLRPDLTVARAASADYFLGASDRAVAGARLPGWTLPPAVGSALEARLRNEGSPALDAPATNAAGVAAVLSLPPFSPRAAPPRTVRVFMREPLRGRTQATVTVGEDGRVAEPTPALWTGLTAAARARVADLATRRRTEVTAPEVVESGGSAYRIHAMREEINFPYRPCRGHPMGLDSSGRDVLARLLYGFRISVSFGLILVCSAIFIGTCIGAMQGYFVGWVDLFGQRLTEIWQALPFLFIIMLAGSVFGRSFLLLLVVYALFNWIGMSYYMRAEFLRLRKMPYIEAARSIGLRRRRILFRHILPNALVPIITFFPFSLVGAIGSLSALDYLGFGMPPPTPSWGELLLQAQQQESAWWLILYPFLALFTVILLGVFIGEGVREAFDPRKYARMQ